MNNYYKNFVNSVMINNDLSGMMANIKTKYNLCNSFKYDKIYVDINTNEKLTVSNIDTVKNNIKYFFENDFKTYIDKLFNKDNMNLLFDDYENTESNNIIYNIHQFLKSINYNKEDLVNYILNK